MGVRPDFVWKSLMLTSLALAGCKCCTCEKQPTTGSFYTNTPTGTAINQTSARPALMPESGARQPNGMGPYPRGNMVSNPGTLNAPPPGMTNSADSAAQCPPTAMTPNSPPPTAVAPNAMSNTLGSQSAMPGSMSPPASMPLPASMPPAVTQDRLVTQPTVMPAAHTTSMAAPAAPNTMNLAPTPVVAPTGMHAGHEAMPEMSNEAVPPPSEPMPPPSFPLTPSETPSAMPTTPQH
jgi:hypothetical protein